MNTKYIVDESRLKQLHSDGLSNRAIGVELSVPHWTIARELKKHGLKTNALRGAPPVAVDENHSLCGKCGEIVRNEDFPWVQGKADGRRLSYCRPCRYKQTRQALTSKPEVYFKDKQSRLRRNTRGLEYNLAEGYLVNLWERQKGLCFYTDLPMTIGFDNGRSKDAASVDRVDSSRGYVEGNLVLCSDRINACKRDLTFEEMRLWTPMWYQRLVDAGLQVADPYKEF